MSRPEPVQRERILGWGLSGLVLLFLAMDAGGKLIAPAQMIAYSPPIGIPAEPGLYQQLGVILAVCALLYAVPRTAVLGAILLTAIWAAQSRCTGGWAARCSATPCSACIWA
ncbi:hypothetical protein HNP52_000131 [Sphingomonas kyeonggiensis]|uniref:DoxX-like protein n=1 Tax=Sphingomonas kyeonggiensis TaxID=1268553 RepID=A0A7W7NPG2_9SPHN|nr:DoxX family protein [Sphingomonas kyeonggiensis]MBB4837080.1 hypothetical protein [Sphingomonas kyeonggiensis]